MLQIRKALASKNAIRVFRILFGLVALALISGAIKSVQVIQVYDVQFGTTFWFVNSLIVVSSIVGVICIWMMAQKWDWAVWVWAVVVLGVALIGIWIGLNVGFLTRWDVFLPWIVLLAFAMLKTRFAMPWKNGGTGRTVAGIVGVLVCFAVGANSIHQKVAAERNVFLEPLKETLEATNQQLPKMVNEELRLDRVSVELDGYHQYLTFPQYTAAELKSDPGLDYVRDYYVEVYSTLICELPLCQQRLADGGDCRGKYHHELVDMNGELVVSFSLDGSYCQ